MTIVEMNFIGKQGPLQGNILRPRFDTPEVNRMIYWLVKTKSLSNQTDCNKKHKEKTRDKVRAFFMTFVICQMNMGWKTP